MNFHRKHLTWLGAIAAVWIVLLSGYAWAQTSALPSVERWSVEASDHFVCQTGD